MMKQDACRFDQYFSMLLLMLGVVAMGLTSTPAMALTLVQDGEARVVLVLPAEPTELEAKAAAEIRDYVRRISGAELQAVESDAELKGLSPLYVGAAAEASLLDAVREEGNDPASFVLQVADDRAAVCGLSEQGTLFAAYELLEQLGVRWFMPGELGTVVPERATLKLEPQTNVQVPSFATRNMNEARHHRAWGQRMRMGGEWFPPAHGVLPFKGSSRRTKYFESHPEYFSLVDGERVMRQLCVSNPEVLALAIEATKAYFRKHPDRPWIGMGPNDGSAFCECDDCRALDGGNWDVFSNEASMTDRYIWFFNQVLAGIEDEFPDKKIAFYIYHTYQEPPVKVEADERVVGAVAPIALCRVHGPNNPICPEKSYYRQLIGAWSESLSEVYDRGYWFNLADPGMPFVMVHRLREQIPMGHEQGLTGWRVETVAKWAGETPSLYIAAKLMWDHEADVDALLADFHEKFYGPAAEPMAAYTALMDTAMRDGDHHTGGATDMPRLYPSNLRSQARNLLEQAAAMAENEGAYAERVALTRKSFDYLEAFIAMLDARTRGDFAAAQAALDRLQAVQDDLLTGYDMPMLHPRAAESYLKRFWSPATEQGYARTTGGNEPVAMLKDRWQFQLDPQGLGETLGWQGEAEVGGNWQTLRTAGTSWSDQGLRYYKGLAWYRQTVDIADEYKGRRIFLWFGGVDEKAKVWVNGQLIGISPGSAFVPFELDATDAIRAGGPNTVAVQVNNRRVNELGTGGITAPVMFYAPAAGEDAELENTRDLGRTFP